MNVLIPLLLGLGILGIGGWFYSRYIGRAMGVDDSIPTPATRINDGYDYVPTRTHVVFGHHFATIAGAGPIVGPTLAVAYGWGVPWLWIVLGCVLFGAMHDMTTMFVSLREDGRSIGDMCRRTLGSGGYVLFVIFLILMLTLINAIFLNMSCKALTASYPASLLRLEDGSNLIRVVVDKSGASLGRIGGIATTSVFIITALAPLLGWLTYKKKAPTGPLYALAAVICVAGVIAGFKWPVFLGEDAKAAENLWRWIMSAYVLLACWLPVWVLLQPRDFTNVQILYGGLLMMLVGVAVAGFTGHTLPMDQVFPGATGSPAGAVWPFLFITVACGAISGFHSLASTGTTVKQITSESEVRRVGYNAMILEGVLALLALLLVAVALPRQEYLSIVYPAGGDGNPILAFSVATGYMLNSIAGIPIGLGCVLGILVLEGFVVTTLDTAVRLCRYMIDELWLFIFAGSPPAFLKSPIVNTAIAVGLMLFFALNSTIMSAWKIFGAGNQLIAALALIVVAVWLIMKARAVWFVMIPAVLMVITTFTTLVMLLKKNLATADGGFGVAKGQGPLTAATCLILVLAAGVILIAVRKMLALRAPKTS